MNNTVHYTNCPVCGSADIKNVLSAKDYTASNETFYIAECNSCTLRFTQDVPDANSISAYYKSENYISHTNTSKGFINRIYKIVRKRTMREKRKLVEKITSIRKGQLLDIGSGIGSFVNEMKQCGWNVTGLEPDEEARNLAKQVYQLELKNTNEFYKLPSGSFDVITLWQVLEHVHDLHAYIQQLKILLKENGKLFIAVPNYTSKDAAIYKEYWAAYDVPRHLYHFSPQAIQVLIEKNGLKLLQHRPMWYDSFYVSLLSSKYKNDRANLFTSFWNGACSDLKAMGDVEKCSSIIYIISK
jgi:2-polyprenyl-3-methyl-5-hydroxy-6-metoxy-1,4-benzoquinol methylase